jgi:hypothetical protein
MESPKIQVKFFTKERVELEHFVPVFHRFIRDHVLDDLVIDVADYSHVHQGPGVVLVGHACDFYVDESEGRQGLLYSKKRDPGPPEQRVLEAFKKALNVCRLLEQEEGLGAHFRSDEALVRLPDRVTAPNTEEGFALLKSGLESVVSRLYGDSARIERVGDKGTMLTARIQAQATASISDLLGRL